MTNVLIYSRLSTVDVHESTDRQESACRSFAEAREWEVTGVLTDTAASAYRPGAKRPGFEALFEEADRRTCDGLLVWKFDRLVRRPADFERLWDVAEKRGVFLASVVEPIDSSTPLGVAMLRILVALAGLESATLSARVAATAREAAEAGARAPGKRFGHTCDGEIDPEEAAFVREAAERVLAGEGLNPIAADFRERGVRSSRNKPCTGNFLRFLLRNQRLVGDRTFKGEVLGPGCYPAILDRDTWERVQLVLARPDRAVRPQRQAGWLIPPGLLRCGFCDSPLTHSSGNGRRKYACQVAPWGCRRVSVIADHLEPWLLDQLAEHLGRARTQIAAVPGIGPADLADSLRRLSNDFYVQGAITREEFFAARGLLLRDADHRDTPRPEKWVAALLRRTDRRAALAALSLERQQTLLTECLESIHLGPVSRQGVRFDPDRFHLRWRGSTSPVPGGVRP